MQPTGAAFLAERPKPQPSLRIPAGSLQSCRACQQTPRDLPLPAERTPGLQCVARVSICEHVFGFSRFLVANKSCMFRSIDPGILWFWHGFSTHNEACTCLLLYECASASVSVRRMRHHEHCLSAHTHTHTHTHTICLHCSAHVQICPGKSVDNRCYPQNLNAHATKKGI